ncbi:AAA family ATPase [Bacillus sp. FJAT-45350]|uniref:AAA family ATPase n=1 Tax=Bacillus sp. FJAT-45350 TaxID=2011014 RepID=UPI000BB7D1C6|nr:AAA family ATPase [Bacillus sp. FJAT-45350]
MNTIKSVRLENFQSHLDTRMEFDNGLNVIVGQSDSGKTAILRGIRWALFNQPRGTDMMRVGADFIRVTITLSTNVKIVRERTASKNRYIIKKPDIEDLVLEGFGVHVPEEVLEAHGIRTLRVDRDHELSLHIAGQLDGPFLLEQTATVRAKAIGRISGAHFLDMAFRETAKDVSKLQQSIKFHEDEITKTKEKLIPFETLDEKKKSLEQSEANLLELKRKQTRSEELKKLQQMIYENQGKQDKLKEFQTTLSDISMWEASYQKLTNEFERVRNYRQKKRQQDELEKAINKCKEWIEKTSLVTKAQESIQKLKQQVERLQLLKVKEKQYVELTKSSNRANTILEKTSFAKKENDFHWNWIEEGSEKLRKLEDTKVRYTNLLKEKERYSNALDNLKGIDQVKENSNKLEEGYHRYTSFISLRSNMNELKRRIKEGKEFVQQKVTEEQEFSRQYESYLIEHRTCPTCGGIVDANEVKKLLK